MPFLDQPDSRRPAMFTNPKIATVEYHIGKYDAVNADSMAYYSDEGAGKDQGVWWCSQPSAYQTTDKTGESTLRIPFVQHHQPVNPRALRDLANGQDPISKQRIRQNHRRGQMVGYDAHFGAPKDVSVLWAFAPDDETKKIIEQAQIEAMHESLDHAHKNGYITTRRGKGGAIAETPAELCSATFLHNTNRDGDPHIHGHNVILNVCRRADGSTGTIDNERLLQHQMEMGAIYRLALANKLSERLGVKCEQHEREFRIVGMPENIKDVFSKRRRRMEEIAQEQGIDLSTERVKADFIAVSSRGKKSELPADEELAKRWDRELQNEGWSREGIWESVRLHGKPENQQAPDIQELILDAIAEAETTQSAIEEPHLNACILMRLQGVCSLPDALQHLERAKQDGTILAIGENKKGKVFATLDMIETEQGLLRDAIQRRGEREFVPVSAVDQAISKRPTMSEEQAEAVRHALNQDGVSAIEGSAGTGKSFSLGTVVECARECGFKTHAIAPSHKAKDVLRGDTGTSAEDAHTVIGFIHRITNPEHPKAIMLTSQDAIILDEAGMVGTKEMASLLQVARQAGAKVILAGDTRQLQPVASGSPMSMIAGTCGTQRISRIRRQQTAWQRDASERFARGDTADALHAYDERGGIVMGTREDVIQTLTRDWRKDVEEHPAGSRVVLATRNADVKILNEALRDQAREAGILSGQEWTVKAKNRGRNGIVSDLSIAIGERLIFGETVAIQGAQINNSDQATILDIVAGHDGDPVVTLELDKGGQITAPWSEFAKPPRKRGDTRGPVLCQHAYAVTVHASQGMTVDNAFVLNSEGMGQESAYVAMTRHRHNATMYVDSDRIASRLANNQQDGEKFTVYSDGRGRCHDDQDDAEDGSEDQEIERADILKALARECSQKENKVNVSDFITDRKAWAGIDVHPVAPDEIEDLEDEEHEPEDHDYDPEELPQIARQRVRKPGPVLTM